ncbi:protein-L-isoaspartate O-methyltransferase [Patescibacteria group bacterium]|nr:protein-L-isoaspartate O-methyltransferase [Patescibacteria group bacterium]
MLTDQLIQNGYLKTLRIIDAFKKIKRKDFIPDALKQEAEQNCPLSIGYGQTISQPLTVAFMLELLNPMPGDKILDIGSGSGWATALLSHCVSQQGKIIAIEIIPELIEFGKQNMAKYGFIKKSIVKFFCKDGSQGLARYAPYDKIHVAAEVQNQKVPQALKKQLALGGRMVIPIKNGILKIDKISKNKFKQEFFPGFVFVPLVLVKK